VAQLERISIVAAERLTRAREQADDDLRNQR
jgi:hypothetical protein